MAIVTVVAKIVANKDRVAEVKAELLKLVGPTRKETGCIEYRLHQDNDDPAVFIFYENWESRAALESHMNSSHFKTYIGAVEGFLEDKAVHLMTAVA